MTSPSTLAPAAVPADSASAPSSGLGADNVNENQFLELLVAQIRYQDPTNPTDSTTFVTQLAQFSSLEQLIAIRGDMDSVTQGAVGTTSTSSTQGGN